MIGDDTNYVIFKSSLYDWKWKIMGEWIFHDLNLHFMAHMKDIIVKYHRDNTGCTLTSRIYTLKSRTIRSQATINEDFICFTSQHRMKTCPCWEVNYSNVGIYICVKHDSFWK